MPVSATIVESACASQSSCAELQTLNPSVTFVEGRESTQRLMAVECQQGQVVSLNWPVRDLNGARVDLSTCGTVVAKLRLREALAGASADLLADITGTVTDAANGEVLFQLTAVHTANPGVFIGEIGIQDGSANLLLSQTFYVVINQGLYATGTYLGPPRLSEIRLHLRIGSGVDSTLLEQREWDVGELAYAITRPVMYWNEAGPDVGVTYTTTTFPYRFNWMDAIVGELMLVAASSYRRDHLPYSAAGISVDDKNKWQQYEAEGYRRRQMYEIFVQKKKSAINEAQGYGSFVSEYSF